MLIYTKTILLLYFSFLNFFENPRDRITPQQYIQSYKEDAIKQMELHNIPASITLAQGMLESGNGNSELAVKANNHFGIKCHKDWKGPTMLIDDDKKNECFRKYSNVFDSYNDHALFLTSRSNYAKLFELKITDYKAWAKGLKQAGYATDPNYPKRLIDIIEKYELYQYDTFTKSSKKTKKAKKTKEGKEVKEEKDKKEKSAASNIIASQKVPQREILRLGIKKYIIIKEGDTFYSLAKETDKDLWQLYKYNDLSEGDKLIIGNKLFLQPKRNKANIPFHTVKTEETMKSISQFYGIKLKKLYRKNNMYPGEEPKPGDILNMQKSKPTDSF